MECEAEIRLLSQQKQLAPAASAFARLVLSQPTLLLPGDRFILRSFSPVHTIAGGQILDLHFSSQRLKRLGQAERLALWATQSPAQRSLALVSATPFGLPLSEVLLRLAIDASQLDHSLLTADHWLLTPQQLAAA
ncbi:hypothetical protein WDZ92_47210, partial [Nostoc sp. NIES-2111]